MECDLARALELSPVLCPDCNHSTRYTGWWFMMGDVIGPVAQVICTNCEYTFVYILNPLELLDDWMFDEEEEE